MKLERSKAKYENKSNARCYRGWACWNLFCLYCNSRVTPSFEIPLRSSQTFYTPIFATEACVGCGPRSNKLSSLERLQKSPPVSQNNTHPPPEGPGSLDSASCKCTRLARPCALIEDAVFVSWSHHAVFAHADGKGTC